MTEAEKARELYNKFYNASDGAGISIYKNKQQVAKQCALIACQEILELKLIEDNDLQETTKSYWNEVKNHLKHYNGNTDINTDAIA